MCSRVKGKMGWMPQLRGNSDKCSCVIANWYGYRLCPYAHLNPGGSVARVQFQSISTIAMAASSALLRSAARSIPRALGAELRFSSRPTENAPRRLYSAAATAGPQGPQPNMVISSSLILLGSHWYVMLARETVDWNRLIVISRCRNGINRTHARFPVL